MAKMYGRLEIIHLKYGYNLKILQEVHKYDLKVD